MDASTIHTVGIFLSPAVIIAFLFRMRSDIKEIREFLIKHLTDRNSHNWEVMIDLKQRMIVALILFVIAVRDILD